MTRPPRIGITLDCADPEPVAAFWETFLGYERRPHEAGATYITLDRSSDVDGPPNLTFQRVPEPKVGKARVHLDLFVAHAGPMVDDMIAAGATRVATTEAGEWTTRVMQDPAGNEFCVIGPG
ncbi:MAG TPA: VOC family protein [Euzebya sp.]|nr:VOC family protein [Euzebya sp.]